MSAETDAERFGAHEAEKLARYEAGVAWERQAVERLDVLADELVALARDLGWGSGEPWLDACYRVHAACLRAGIPAGFVEGARTREPLKRKAISKSLTRQVWDRDGWECVFCGSHRDLAVDHDLPVARGGTNDIDLLLTCCATCNSEKGTRTADEYRAILALRAAHAATVTP